MALNVANIRKDFPSLGRKIQGHMPIYLDNACMTLKPNSVIQAMSGFYENHPSCHKRSLHAFGRLTSEKFDAARASVSAHIHAAKPEEIIFTRNTTESINLVARCLRFRRGDVVVTSDFEHNSNLLPWQFLAQREGVEHKMFTIPPDLAKQAVAEKVLSDLEKLLKAGRVKIVSTFHTSHISGLELPIKEMAQLAHAHGAIFLLDAAQGMAHHQIDVSSCDVDLMAFSFHKAFGPTGMGALYGKFDLLHKMEPFLVGGETIDDVDYDSCVPAAVPARFEAGLQNYAGAIGGACGLEYLRCAGIAEVEAHVAGLSQLLAEKVADIPKIQPLWKLGTISGSIFNFLVGDLNCGELSVLLDKSYGIMTRSGVHCCHAWYRKNKLQPSLRVSFSLYNSVEEVEILSKALRDITKFF